MDDQRAQRPQNINNLMRDFPALALIRHEWKRRVGKKWQLPTMRVHVQRADPESMHLQALRNFGILDCSYVGGEKNLRGTRFEYMIAVDHNDRIAAALFWNRGESEKMSKDIFKLVKPEDVSYLIWVSAIEWHAPSKPEEEKLNVFFGPYVKTEINAIVYRRNHNLTFQQLIETADRLKKEREEAYKHFPKFMPDLQGVKFALQSRCRIHAFSSGGGLRVVRIELDGKLKGYGEAPHVEDALAHADEDYISGGRRYENVYGKKYPHYLTGDTLSTSNIDYWIRRGSTFDAWQEGDLVVFELKGYHETGIPKDIRDRVLKSGEPETYENRGYTYCVERCRFANDELGTSCSVVEKPDDKRSGADPWMYKITKTGKGINFWQAMINAFYAHEVEIPKEELK